MLRCYAFLQLQKCHEEVREYLNDRHEILASQEEDFLQTPKDRLAIPSRNIETIIASNIPDIIRFMLSEFSTNTTMKKSR